jgi:hypothetical protein
MRNELDMGRKRVVKLAAAMILFVFLIPLPLVALQPPQPIEPVAIYGSIASKYLGIGAVFQHPYDGWATRAGFSFGAYCIQQYLGNGAYRMIVCL